MECRCFVFRSRTKLDFIQLVIHLPECDKYGRNCVLFLWSWTTVIRLPVTDWMNGWLNRESRFQTNRFNRQPFVLLRHTWKWMSAEILCRLSCTIRKMSRRNFFAQHTICQYSILMSVAVRSSLISLLTFHNFLIFSFNKISLSSFYCIYFILQSSLNIFICILIALSDTRHWFKHTPSEASCERKTSRKMTGRCRFYCLCCVIDTVARSDCHWRHIVRFGVCAVRADVPNIGHSFQLFTQFTFDGDTHRWWWRRPNSFSCALIWSSLFFPIFFLLFRVQNALHFLAIQVFTVCAPSRQVIKIGLRWPYLTTKAFHNKLQVRCDGINVMFIMFIIGNRQSFVSKLAICSSRRTVTVSLKK